ncbi:hypothetical protein MMC20_006332 [Loxospora ochrophaea]|nr:hypothetical protein [Loxospora ochrophaea]
MPKDFDLDLGSLWFTELPPKFPVPSMRAQGPSTSTYSYDWEQDFGGMKKVLVTAVRWTSDLSSTKVQVKWNDSNPLGTIEFKQKHFPPPAALTAEELDKAHQEYGSNIASWSESVVDTTVGDGECWTLVAQALDDLAQTYRQYGKEAPLICQGRSHGYCILWLVAPSPGSNRGLLELADVRRGDILQMSSACFQMTEEAPAVQQEWGKWQKGSGSKTIRMAHHTAVIIGIEGDVMHVVEQNGEMPHGVGKRSYNLEEMQEGEAQIYRVVGEKWCPPLDAKWD